MRPAACEAVAELLQEMTRNGVSIEPPIEALGPDEGYILDYEAPLLLHAYIYGVVEAARRKAIRARLGRAELGGDIVGRIDWRTIREEDWATAWKAHYNIEKVGRIVIRPAWLEYEPKGREVVVGLDPGMAFGTGQHPTTRLCLQEMQTLLQAGDRVLDLGCGSGILGLAALALGAAFVVAVDTEEQAVASTAANAALNAAEEGISILHGSIDAVTTGPFDLVLANINAATIAALAVDIAAALRPEGWLVVSGIIEERQEAPLQALLDAGLRLERRLADGDWRAFVLQKPALA